MTGADIDLADLWRRTLLALESAGVSPSERAFVGFARLMAVIEQTALIAVPNDYTKSIIEHRVNDTVVRNLSAQLGREVRLAVAIDQSLDPAIRQIPNISAHLIPRSAALGKKPVPEDLFSYPLRRHPVGSGSPPKPPRGSSFFRAS